MSFFQQAHDFTSYPEDILNYLNKLTQTFRCDKVNITSLFDVM